MPFKSEKQRRYLWANEPEIARDWTKTYGSKVKKADGGRIGLRRGGNPHSDGPSRSTSRSNDRSHDRGGDRHRHVSTPTRSRIQRDRQADFKANPKNYITQDRGGNLPNRRSVLDNWRQTSIDKFVNRNKYKNLKEKQINAFLLQTGILTNDAYYEDE